MSKELTITIPLTDLIEMHHLACNNPRVYYNEDEIIMLREVVRQYKEAHGVIQRLLEVHLHDV